MERKTDCQQSSLMSIIETLMENGADKHWGQTMREALKDAKRYLKTDFKAHVGRDKNSSDHSTVHAFSDPSDLNLSGECQHCHDTRCDRCECLDMALEEITQKLDELDITEDQRARIKLEQRMCQTDSSMEGTLGSFSCSRGS